MASTTDILNMSETELLRRGSVSKTLLVQALTEPRKQKDVEGSKNTSSDLESILSRKLDPLMRKLETITDSIGNLKARVDHLQEDCSELRKTKRLAFDYEEVCREACERLYRRKYLVISGIPEQDSGTVSERKEADCEAITEVAAAVGVQHLKLTEVSRIGLLSLSKPRLLRFKCSDSDDRRTLLTKSRDLKSNSKYSRTYINPDQTKIQREHAKAMRAELKSRWEKGEEVIIKYDKIVSKSELRQNFH